MLIGERTAAWGGGGWTNPYITEGLIAMWHGLWNVGGGLPHDDNATTWCDISGNGHDIDLTNATVGSDFIKVENKSIGCSLPNVQRLEFTAEIVVNSNPLVGSALWIANPTWVGGLLMDWSGTGQYYYPWANLVSYNLNHGQLASIQLTYKEGNQKLFVNGTKIRETNGNIDSRSYLTRLKLGEYNGSFATSEIYKCVRLYDKWFTDNEILANHAEDFREFGV